ncbi:MAG TPA: hypothetical protein VFV87_21040, partial [Pirellulaceae bacterium]|nr:hypothetical protein [Pirellulaceae bacterium]
INTEMMTAVNSYIESLLNSLPQRENAQGFKNFMQRFLTITIYVSVGGFYVLMLAKAAVYLFGLIYLRKPHIRELYQTVPAKLAKPAQ